MEFCKKNGQFKLLLRKVMTNLDSIFKSSDITLPTKVHLVKAMVFPVLEKTLESPLDCKEIQLVLKEISSEYTLEGLMLKLKLQYLAT